MTDDAAGIGGTTLRKAFEAQQDRRKRLQFELRERLDAQQDRPPAKQDVAADGPGVSMLVRWVGPDGRPQVFRLVRGRFTIGRAQGSDLRLTDEWVSGRHAQFIVDEGGVLLEEIAAKNGTDVNGERISEPTMLHIGDRLMLGSTELIIEAEARDD